MQGSDRWGAVWAVVSFGGGLIQTAEGNPLPVGHNCAHSRYDLTPIVVAFAKLDNGELLVVIDATNNVPQITPWIEGACDWEVNRRRGCDYELQTAGHAAYSIGVRIPANVGDGWTC